MERIDGSPEARAVLSWSGGKDATYALFEIEGTSLRVEELLTTISESTGRSSMHGVRRELYEAQAAALDLPINVVTLPDAPDNEEYAKLMNRVMEGYAEGGIDRVVFGDIFLEGIREYREERLGQTPIDGAWPLWGVDTTEFVDSFLDAGFEAIVVAANDEQFDPEDTGRPLDEAFLDDLPPEVDPAGEHGEFHTFVVDGPIFESRVRVETGERVSRPVGNDTTMHYCDLLLAEE